MKWKKNNICDFFFLQILVLSKFSLDPRQWTEVETYCLRISHLKRQLKSILWILQVISQFICLKLNFQELLVKWATTKKFSNRWVKYMKWRCRCKFNFFKIWFTTRHIFFAKKNYLMVICGCSIFFFRLSCFTIYSNSGTCMHSLLFLKNC